MNDRRIRNLVMLGVLLTWMGYMGFSMAILHTAPEKWTWGIAPGAYAALYRSWLTGRSGQGQQGDGDDEADQRPVRRRDRQRSSGDDS